LTCHTQTQKDRGAVPIALDSLDLSKVPDQAETWEKVIRKLRGGLMPPPGLPRPDRAASQNLISWLETELDNAAAAKPNPGRPLLHRLNRTEYVNAIRDLLALDIDGASFLPPDDSAYGFDNISDALGISPSLQERYLSAALKIGALAIGVSHVSPSGETYRIRQDLSQDQHIEGMPLGTIGGTRVLHNFPLDGEYLFQARLYRTNLSSRGLNPGARSRNHGMASGACAKQLAGRGSRRVVSEADGYGDEVDARLRVRIPGEGRSARGDYRFCSGARDCTAPTGCSATSGLCRQLRLVGTAIQTLAIKAVQCDRRGRHTKPAPDFRVSSSGPECRSALRKTDHLDAGTPGVPPTGHQRRPAAADELL
jgi:hypothetical protein